MLPHQKQHKPVPRPSGMFSGAPTRWLSCCHKGRSPSRYSSCLQAFPFVPFNLPFCAFQSFLCAFSACPFVPFGLTLCALQPPVGLSALPSAPVSLPLAPLSIPLCTLQPAHCTFLAFPFTGLTGAPTGDEHNIHAYIHFTSPCMDCLPDGCGLHYCHSAQSSFSGPCASHYAGQAFTL